MTGKPTYEELEKKIQELERSEPDFERSKKALQESKDRFQLLYERAPLAYQSLDENGNFIEVNSLWLAVLGYSREEVIGKFFGDFLRPDWKDHFKENFPRFKAIGEVLGLEFEMIKKDGSLILVSFNGKISKNKDGNFQQTHCILQDITDRKRTENALQKSEYRLAIHLQNTPVGAISWDLNFKVVEWNPAAETIFGYSKEEVIDRHPTEIILPNDIKEFIDGIFQDLLSERGGTRSTNENTTKDGRRIICDWYNTTLKDPNGKIIGVASLVNDITERKLLEKSLQRSEELLKATQHLTKVGGWEWDLEKQTMFWTDEVYQIHNFQPSEFVPGEIKHIERGMECYDPEDRPVIMAAFKRCVEQGKAYDLEFPFTTAMGRRIWIRTVAKPVLKDDRIVRVLGNIIDITKQKEAFEDLKEQKEFNEKIIQTSSALITGLDKNHKIKIFNKGAERITGFKSQEVIDKDWFKIFFKPDIYDEMYKVWKISWGAKYDSYVNPIQVKNGDEKIISWQTTGMYDSADETKHMLLSIGEDITARRQTEKHLRESEEKYRSMMNAMKDPVYICSKDYRIEYMNPAMIRTLDCDATGEKCFKAIHGLDKICTWCMHSKIFKTECFEYNIISPRNKRHYQISSSPIVYEDGSISKMTIFKDITDLFMIEEQYRQAQKMESVGRLAGGVAHDFNNALSVIISTAELALDDVDPTGQLREDLDEILMAGKRAADITRQLLAFARKQTISPKVLDLNENVESMLKMLRRLIGEDIELAWLPGANLWSVKIDSSQIDQILANLCVNARDAIEGVGKVAIETKTIVFDSSYCSDHAGFVPGEFVLLTVSDNGCGMNKELLDNIFEPFFTTKDVDKGTGLGLSTVYGIVKQNRGFINVYSEPDKGTTIKIYLPRHDTHAVEIHEKNIEEIPLSQGETILVVEDDSSILKIMQKILEGLGYNVLISNAPEKSMGIIKEYTGKIHLLITDVIMPKMNGRDLAELLQSICPDLKCIFMSGYTANAIVNQGVLDEGINFIQKPFSRREVAEIVRKVLDNN